MSLAKHKPLAARSGVFLFFTPVAPAPVLALQPQDEQGARYEFMREADHGAQSRPQTQEVEAAAREPLHTSPASSGMAAEPDGVRDRPLDLSPPMDGNIGVPHGDGAGLRNGTGVSNNDNGSPLVAHAHGLIPDSNNASSLVVHAHGLDEHAPPAAYQPARFIEDNYIVFPTHGEGDDPHPKFDSAGPHEHHTAETRASVAGNRHRLFSTEAVIAGHKWSVLVSPDRKDLDYQVSAYLIWHGLADCAGATPAVAKDCHSNVGMLALRQQWSADPAGNVILANVSTSGFYDSVSEKAIARCLHALPSNVGSTIGTEADDYLVVDVSYFDTAPREGASELEDNRVQAPKSEPESSFLPELNVVVEGVLTLISARIDKRHMKRRFSQRFCSRNVNEWIYLGFLPHDTERAHFIHKDGCLHFRADINVFDARYCDLRTRIENAGTLRDVDWLTVISSVHEMPIFADYKVSEFAPRSLLHLAVRERKHEYVSYLLHEGADVNAQDSWSQSPLHVAVDYEDVELVRALVLKYSANVEAADRFGESPLFSAVRIAALRMDVARALVACLVCECGADINAKNSSGRTVLFSAARIGDLEFVHWLVLDLKADIIVTDNDGHNAASRAVQYRHEQVAMFLSHPAHGDTAYQ